MVMQHPTHSPSKIWREIGKHEGKHTLGWTRIHYRWQIECTQPGSVPKRLHHKIIPREQAAGSVTLHWLVFPSSTRRCGLSPALRQFVAERHQRVKTLDANPISGNHPRFRDKYTPFYRALLPLFEGICGVLNPIDTDPHCKRARPAGSVNTT